MSFDLRTCRWVVWGYKNSRHTHSYIHAGFVRALRHLGKSVEWLDGEDNVAGRDFSNVCFVGQNDSIQGMPLRQDCFYLIHNAYGCVDQLFDGLKMVSFGVHLETHPNQEGEVALDPYGGAPFFFAKPFNYFGLRWATDLLPEEIAAHRPTSCLNISSSVVHHVGVTHPDYWETLAPFAQACEAQDIRFVKHGGYERPPVESEEHVRLIRESHLAPAIQPRYQVESGYVPCRIFKNISYGQFGLTNSPYVQRLFDDRLVYEPDTRRLFFSARERLASEPIDKLHVLMDHVAARHTYLNRVAALERAVEVTLADS